MIEDLTISAHIHDSVHVFALNLPPEQVPAFVEAGQDRWPLKEALGAEALDPAGVDVIRVEDLTGVGLPGYLIEGSGMDPDAIEADRARLAALSGHVVLIHASAFEGTAQTLLPGPELTFIARYSGPGGSFVSEPLRSASAEGQISGTAEAPPSEAKMSGRVATIALLVLFVLVALMIWVAV
ncbi:hypothetical protein AAD018_002795 [Aestuariibius insulae]|uniref:hypothetical protein n=1 Tax=Aestuariibius insulae TaxID=2058287 RepID=UPI00345E5B27